MTKRVRHLLLSVGLALIMAVGMFGTAVLAGGPIVEPEVQILHTHTGENVGDSFGWVGAKLGDLNNDGFDDYLTTANVYTSGVSGRGRAYVYSGIDGTSLATHTGASPNQMGYSAASAGDVNNDGTPDYILGGIGSYTPATRGKAWIYSGATHTLIREFEGELGASFGSGVAGIGDVNGDGFDDVVVGSEWYSSTLGVPPPRNGTGRIYVYSGADGSLLWGRNGDNPGDFLGSGVGAVEDVNNDGVGDIVASARRANNANGLAYVFSGVDGTRLYTMTPTAPFSQSSTLGQFFAFGAGDFNNDDQQDIYIGDYGAGGGDGRVYLYSGTDGSLIRAIDAFDPGEGLGGGRGVPDLNNDGYDDLIIAGYTNSDGASGGGKVYIVSGADDNDILSTITGAIPGDLLGVDALEVGDVNNDGNRDYMVTAVGLDFSGQGVGHAYIVTFIEPTAVTLNAMIATTTLPIIPIEAMGALLACLVGIYGWRRYGSR